MFFFIISFPPTYVINFCSRYPLLHLHSLCVSARTRRQRHIKLHFNSTVLDCRWTVEYYLNLYVLLSCIEPQEQLPRLDICNRSCIAQPSVTDTSTGWTKTVDPDHQVRFRIQRHHFILIYKHMYIYRRFGKHLKNNLSTSPPLGRISLQELSVHNALPWNIGHLPSIRSVAPPPNHP